MPNLKGKTEAAERLEGKHCTIGKVKRLGDATSKSAKVKAQSPKTGKVLAPGSKVNVKLG